LTIRADKAPAAASQSLAHTVQSTSGGSSSFQYLENRAAAVTQRKLHSMANTSPRALQLQAMQELANNSPQIEKIRQLPAPADDELSHQPSVIQGHFHSSKVSLTRESNAFKGVSEGSAVSGGSYAAFGPIDNFIDTPGARVIEDRKKLVVGHLVKKEYGGLGDIPNVLPWGKNFEHGNWVSKVEAKVDEKLRTEMTAWDDVDLNYLIHGDDSDDMAADASRMLSRLVTALRNFEPATLVKLQTLIQDTRALSQIPKSVSVSIRLTPRSVHVDPYSEKRTYQDIGDGGDIGYRSLEIINEKFPAAELEVPTADLVMNPQRFIEKYLVRDFDTNLWKLK
jgi:hypothetical protein